MSVGNYVESLSKAAHGRDSDATKGRARDIAARAGISEYKLARLRGELLLAADMERAYASAMRYLRGSLLAVPKRLGGVDRRTMAEVDREIRECLTELANSREFAGFNLRPPANEDKPPPDKGDKAA